MDISHKFNNVYVVLYSQIDKGTHVDPLSFCLKENLKNALAGGGNTLFPVAIFDDLDEATEFSIQLGRKLK